MVIQIVVIGIIICSIIGLLVSIFILIKDINRVLEESRRQDEELENFLRNKDNPNINHIDIECTDE